MAQISDILYWLFNTRDGVMALIALLILFFTILAIISERKTKRLYYNHEVSDEDMSILDSRVVDDAEKEWNKKHNNQ